MSGCFGRDVIILFGERGLEDDMSSNLEILTFIPT